MQLNLWGGVAEPATKLDDYRQSREDEIVAEALEILERRLRGRNTGEVIDSPETVRQFLKLRLAPREQEVFCCLFLDNRHRVIAFEEMFRGTIDAASVYPREIVKRALALNAAALVLAHNHPSGVAEPSRADRMITDRIREALGLVDIRLLDHLVVGEGEPVSFAERGLI